MEEEVLVATTERPTLEYNPDASTHITLYPWYHYIGNCILFGLCVILIIGTIIGIGLICCKHKGKKGLWKKIVKWELIFILIMVALWFIVSLIMRILSTRSVSVL